jgi:hypothetical protein
MLSFSCARTVRLGSGLEAIQRGSNWFLIAKKTMQRSNFQEVLGEMNKYARRTGRLPRIKTVGLPN